jgi:predicted permease
VLSGVSVPLFNLLAVAVLDFYSGREIKPGKMLLDILKNPLIIGCALGIAALLLGIHFPAPIHTALRDMSRVASPLMLFLLGAFFRFDQISSKPKELIAVLLGRLIVLPALGLLGAVLLGFRGIELASLMVLFGSSTAVASFTMAQQMGGDAELAGDIVVSTSVFSAVTMFLWIFAFKTLGVF